MILSMSPSGIDSLPAMYPLKTASLTFNSAASLGIPPSCNAVCAKTRRAPLTFTVVPLTVSTLAARLGRADLDTPRLRVFCLRNAHGEHALFEISRQLRSVELSGERKHPPIS